MPSFLIDVKGNSQVKLGNYNIDEVLKELQQELDKDIALPHSLKSLIKVLLIIVPLLCQRDSTVATAASPLHRTPIAIKRKPKAVRASPVGRKDIKGAP